MKERMGEGIEVEGKEHIFEGKTGGKEASEQWILNAASKRQKIKCYICNNHTGVIRSCGTASAAKFKFAFADWRYSAAL